MFKKPFIYIIVLIILLNALFFFYINKVNGIVYSYYEANYINQIGFDKIYNMTSDEINDFSNNQNDYHMYYIYGNLFNSSLFTAERLTVNSKNKNVWVDSTSLSEGYLKLLPKKSCSFRLRIIVKINNFNDEEIDKIMKKIKIEIKYSHHQLFYKRKTTIHASKDMHFNSWMDESG